MTAKLFLGNLLTALGPSTAIFLFVVSRRPQQVILFIGGAFFWLLSVFLTSFLFFVISPLHDVWSVVIPVSVLLQELVRWWFFRVYARSEKGLAGLTPGDTRLDDLSSSLAAGLGFAVAQVVLLYVTILTKATGPGTLFTSACTDINYFTVSALYSFTWSLIQVFLMVLAFNGYRRNDIGKIVAVWVLHAVFAGLSAVNTTRDGCLTGLPVFFLLTALLGCLTGVIASRDATRTHAL